MSKEQNMMPFKVLETITPSKIGGAEVFVSNFCKFLQKENEQFGLFCPESRPFYRYAKDNGIEPISWKTYGKIDPFTIIKLVKLIKSGGFSVIHTHLSTASLLGAYTAKLAGVPSVAHVHGLNSATCFKKSSLIIAVSQSVKKHLVEQGIDESRIKVCYNGVDLTAFSPVDKFEARDKLGLNGFSQLFGVFGRLSAEKNQELAIKAFSQVLKDYPAAGLLIVGDGNQREHLELFADNLRIKDKVIFTGFKSDIREYMAAVDAVIVPSKKEGFGLAAIEAMAIEKPVIAASVGGLNEIVLDNETGFIFQSDNHDALAEVIIKLTKQDNTQMGKNGRLRVEEKFDYNKQSHELLNILKSV